VIRLLTRAWRPSLAVLAVLTLTATAACGGSDGGNSSSTGKSRVMWTFKQSHVKALQAVAADFTKQTGIAVTVQAYGPDDVFITKVQAAAKTGNLPDVMEVHTNGDDLTFGAAGLLTDLAKDVDDAWLANYRPEVRVDGSVTQHYYEQSLAKDSKTKGIQVGQRFSVPLTIGTFGIVFANKERLAAAGITKAPSTCEELISDFAEVKAKDAGSGGVSLGLKSASTGPGTTAGRPPTGPRSGGPPPSCSRPWRCSRWSASTSSRTGSRSASRTGTGSPRTGPGWACATMPTCCGGTPPTRPPCTGRRCTRCA
jgi:ABC-type glycerol-3-phosphate transport system substrate-binding protein